MKQVIKRKTAVYRNDQFAVQNELRRFDFEKGLDHFRKISFEWLTRLRLQFYLLAVAECETAEAVPLRLVFPILRAEFSRNAPWGKGC